MEIAKGITLDVWYFFSPTYMSKMIVADNQFIGPERCGYKSKNVISEHMLRVNSLRP